MSELSEELQITRSELEEKRSLNEKLEIDLLQLETHKPSINGVRSPHGANGSKDSLGLADLDLGGTKAAPVGRFVYYQLCGSNVTGFVFFRIRPRNQLQYLLHHRRIRLFYLLSRVSVIGSGNEMLNSRKCV